MNEKDHDMLIEMSANVKNLCLKFDKLEAKTDERFNGIEFKIDSIKEHCACRVKDCVKAFPAAKTFWTVTAALFILVCGAYAYPYLL